MARPLLHGCCCSLCHRAVVRDVTPLYNLPKVAGVDTGFNAELERKLEQAKQEERKAKAEAEKLQRELQVSESNVCMRWVTAQPLSSICVMIVDSTVPAYPAVWACGFVL